MEKANEHFYRGEIEDAFLYLNRARKLAPDSADALLLHAKLYYEVDALDCSLQKCQEIRLIAARAGKDFWGEDELAKKYELYMLLFKLYFFSGQFDIVDKCFDALRDIEENEKFEFKEEYYTDGIDAFLDTYRDEYEPFKLIDKDKEVSNGLVKAALELIAHNEFSEALKYLKKGIDASDNETQHNLLVMCYVNSNKYALALAHAKKMLDKKEMRLQGILNIINIAMFKGDKKLMQEYVDLLTASDVSKDDDIDRAITAMMAISRHDLVEFYCRKLLEITPYDADAMYDLACALFNGGKVDEAKSVYKQIYEIFGEDSHARFFLKYCEKGMRISYRMPLPGEAFDVLSEMFADIAKGAEPITLLDSPESRELLYMGLEIDELRVEVVKYLLVYLESKEVVAILKRFFKDISIDSEFKRFVASSIMTGEEPFVFECITTDVFSYFEYDGKTVDAKDVLLNKAYAELIAALIVKQPDGLCDIARYKEFFTEISLALKKRAAADKKKERAAALKNDGIEPRENKENEAKKIVRKPLGKETVKDIKAVAALAFCFGKLNERKRVLNAAEIMDVSEYRIKKIAKEIGPLFETDFK
jgi:tetratricopeptide (TPR) repeat protein